MLCFDDVGPTSVEITPQMNNIMGPFELGSSISRHAGGFKAPGFDCSMPELAAIAPSHYVKFFHPLHVKMAITAMEPLQAKSSYCSQEKKGPPEHTMNDHRAITLRNHILKAHHGYLRSLVYPMLHASLPIAQIGGARGRGTDITNSLIRWNSLHQHSLEKSSVTFFYGVPSAFYTMMG